MNEAPVNNALKELLIDLVEYHRTLKYAKDGIFVGDPYPSTYVDSYGCEVTVTEDYYTGWICEETWCYDEHYQEWYLYDEYCY